MDQIVHFVEKSEQRAWVPAPDRYEFKPTGRLQGLQRLAWRFLEWRGAVPQARDEKVTFTRHAVDTGDILTRLQKARIGIFDYGQEPGEVLIGSEEFAELMGSPMIHHAATFHTEYHRGPQVFGLPVRVIPWMTGVVVMPRGR